VTQGCHLSLNRDAVSGLYIWRFESICKIPVKQDSELFKHGCSSDKFVSWDSESWIFPSALHLNLYLRLLGFCVNI
jgi:hypothetical protein